MHQFRKFVCFLSLFSSWFHLGEKNRTEGRGGWGVELNLQVGSHLTLRKQVLEGNRATGLVSRPATESILNSVHIRRRKSQEVFVDPKFKNFCPNKRIWQNILSVHFGKFGVFQSVWLCCSVIWTVNCSYINVHNLKTWLFKSSSCATKTFKLLCCAFSTESKIW